MYDCVGWKSTTLWPYLDWQKFHLGNRVYEKKLFLLSEESILLSPRLFFNFLIFIMAPLQNWKFPIEGTKGIMEVGCSLVSLQLNYFICSLKKTIKNFGIGPWVQTREREGNALNWSQGGIPVTGRREWSQIRPQISRGSGFDPPNIAATRRKALQVKSFRGSSAHWDGNVGMYGNSSGTSPACGERFVRHEKHVHSVCTHELVLSLSLSLSPSLPTSLGRPPTSNSKSVLICTTICNYGYRVLNRKIIGTEAYLIVQCCLLSWEELGLIFMPRIGVPVACCILVTDCRSCRDWFHRSRLGELCTFFLEQANACLDYLHRTRIGTCIERPHQSRPHSPHRLIEIYVRFN